MKKLSLFATAVFTSLAMFAQEHTELRTPMARTTRFGLDAGVNMARLWVDRDNATNAPNTNSKTAFHVGAFVDIPLGQVVSLKPQVIYSKQGSKISTTGAGARTYEEDLDYIYVAPAALHLMSRGGFVFETGPMVGFLINAKRDGVNGGADVDIKDQRNSTDFMWSTGIGYMSRVGLGAHVRYNHGFTNVIENNNTGITGFNGKMENRLVQVGLMYAFGAHK